MSNPFLFLKRLVPQTLFGRSLMIIITPALLLQVLVLIFFFDRHWDAMTDRLALAVAGEIDIALHNVDIENEMFLKNPQDIAFLKSFRPALGLHILYERGVTISQQIETSSPGIIINEVERLREALHKHIPYEFIIRSDRDEKWYEVLIQLEDGVLRINFPERRLYTATSYIFLLWLIGSGSILFAIAVLFMRNQIRPINKLAMAADRFGRGIDVPKFKPHGAREVRQAAEAFLDMRERIQRQIEQRTAMLSGVSHDLRTPVTRMKLQLELMEETEDILALKNDLSEMEAMISGYLAFVKGDADERHGAVNISLLVQKLADKLKRQNLIIHIRNIEDGHIIRLRQNAIERALTNIIVNACKYGHEAYITLFRDNNEIEIMIEDKGPGIPEKHWQDVFKPFYRIENSRNPDTGGIGLGLAVAQDIIHSHGGTIHLGAAPGGGLSVQIRLPVR